MSNFKKLKQIYRNAVSRTPFHASKCASVSATFTGGTEELTEMIVTNDVYSLPLVAPLKDSTAESHANQMMFTVNIYNTVGAHVWHGTWNEATQDWETWVYIVPYSKSFKGLKIGRNRVVLDNQGYGHYHVIGDTMHLAYTGINSTMLYLDYAVLVPEFRQATGLELVNRGALAPGGLRIGDYTMRVRDKLYPIGNLSCLPLVRTTEDERRQIRLDMAKLKHAQRSYCVPMVRARPQGRLTPWQEMCYLSGFDDSYKVCEDDGTIAAIQEDVEKFYDMYSCIREAGQPKTGATARLRKSLKRASVWLLHDLFDKYSKLPTYNSDLPKRELEQALNDRIIQERGSLEVGVYLAHQYSENKPDRKFGHAPR